MQHRRSFWHKNPPHPKSLDNDLGQLRVPKVVYTPEQTTLTFADVVGHEEHKARFQSILDQMHQRHLDSGLSYRLPKGVLFVGSPGVGKTHFAIATAGQIKSSLFTLAAPDLPGSYAGLAARRVRLLFETARLNSPCVVLLDDIDAIGTLRGSNTSLDPAEREQAVNSLLSQLDGFYPLEGILVVATAQRYDLLDTALRRSGRFDTVFRLQYPTLAERTDLIALLLANAACAPDITPGIIAQLAYSLDGFPHSEIASLVRQTILRGIMADRATITASDLTTEANALITRTFSRRTLEDLAQQSNDAVTRAPAEARVRIWLTNGELIEGYLQWLNLAYLKVLTPEQPRGYIVARRFVSRIVVSPR